MNGTVAAREIPVSNCQKPAEFLCKAQGRYTSLSQSSSFNLKYIALVCCSALFVVVLAGLWW